jgi:hypothetical protein
MKIQLNNSTRFNKDWFNEFQPNYDLNNKVHNRIYIYWR